MESARSVLPLMSIVIPSRNEAEDIAVTLDCILAMDYPRKEVIVVDDSTDDTPSIVKGFTGRGVRLVHRDSNSNGCCGARNHGMKLAQGEIIVLMNADDRPSADFLRRLAQHYENGADYVIVRSKAMNQENIWGKLIAARETQHLSLSARAEWSEGFSCRRDAAESVGYIPGDFPIPFCRDWRFGATLNGAGYKKHVDTSIEMGHVVPGRFASFWGNRVWRGGFSAPSYYYFRKNSFLIAAVREILKSVRNLAILAFVFPKLYEALQLSRFSSHGILDTGAIYAAACVETAATTVGNCKGLVQLFSTQVIGIDRLADGVR